MVNGEETAGHLTGDCANVVGAAAIGGPFFVRPFLSERDFAKPTTSVTIPARAAYPHAFNLVLATFAAAMPSSLAFPDKLPLPLLSRHRLSADLLALLYLHAVDEHAEVLADRDQRRVLVVKLHAQRSVHRLPDFGNRGGRLVADLVGVDDRHPRHQDHHGQAIVTIVLHPAGREAKRSELKRAFCSSLSEL